LLFQEQGREAPQAHNKGIREILGANATPAQSLADSESKFQQFLKFKVMCRIYGRNFLTGRCTEREVFRERSVTSTNSTNYDYEHATQLVSSGIYGALPKS